MGRWETVSPRGLRLGYGCSTPISQGDILDNTVQIAKKYKQQINNLFQGWTLTNKTTQVPWDQKLDLGEYSLDLGTRHLASFKLYPMINCCGIAVSTHAEVAPSARGKGLGTILNALRIDIARNLGYGVLMCTDIESNEYQRKILAKNGWKDVHKFVNPRTRNTVFVSVINL
jgi:GNAT superfamily N-acetyltransferase